MKKFKNILWVAIATLTITSCSKTEENVPLTQETVEITVENFVRKASLRNQEIPFNLTNESGENINDIATFYVNGSAIEGSVFSSAEIGEFEVYAEYEENGVPVTTTSETFEVIIPKRKVVLEDYTGTWCGFCPRVAEAIEKALDATEHLAVVAIHEGVNSDPDPMDFDGMPILRDAFFEPGAGLPQARIDRTTVWLNPQPIDDIVAVAGEPTNVALSINSTLNGNQLITEINVVSEDGITAGDKIVVYLLESGIVHKQTNYYDQDPTSIYFGRGNPILDFVHNDALRISMSAVLGDEVTATGALEEFTKTYNTTIPSDFVTDNLSIVAMLVKADNTARNAQHAHIQENKSYE
ncbi:MAG: Omp28-related outer membrane protein [Patiriisocius sp.]|uniref:Omp28-related outer membrane protein n=1 Tax=Patiriisocius sp. TaxID=2822396 RepID=UPI003EF8EDB9